MMKGLLLALCVAIAGVPVGPVHAADPAPAATIRIDNFTFGPETLTVAVGTAVTWVNQDDIPHALLANDKSFKSKVLDTDQSFTVTFAQPGEYGYFCSLHPHMTGKVVVKG